MKNLSLTIAIAAAATLLTACGGGGGGGGTTATTTTTPTTAAATITVTTQTGNTPTSSDCPRLTSDSAAAAALDLTNPSIKAVNDLLLQVDPLHAYNVFTRRPNDFINWIVTASGGTGKVDFQSLGVATHETLHMDDTALYACAPANQEKYQFFDQQLVTDLSSTSTAPYGIVAETIDPSLTSASRYQTYIVNLGSNSGDDFHALLDELAAYTGGAYLELQYLNTKGSSGNLVVDSNLGGVVNFMVYLENYLKAARLNHAATYAAIQNSASVKAAIQTIWTRAEQVLHDSYPYTKAGSTPQLVVDSAYFTAAYSTNLLSELDALGITHASASSWSGTYLP